MRAAPHKHDVLHREGEVERRRLRHVRHQPGDLTRGVSGERPAQQFHAAGDAAGQQAAQRPEQRRLTGAVRPHQPDQLPRCQAKRHLLQDVSPGNSIRQVFGL